MWQSCSHETQYLTNLDILRMDNVFQGAVAGMLMSQAVSVWLVLGSATIDNPRPFLPVSVEGCNNQSFSAHSFPTQDLRPQTMRDAVLWANGTDVRSAYRDDTVAETSLPQDV